MKKLIITSLLFFFGITSFAQGPLYINNNTHKTIKIQLTAYTVATGNVNPSCNGTYFTALGLTSPYTITILPNTNYTLSNYSTFTPNTTLVNKWQKRTNNVSIAQLLPSQMVGVPIWSSVKCDVFNGVTPYASFGIGKPNNCSGYVPFVYVASPSTFNAFFSSSGAYATISFNE